MKNFEDTPQADPPAVAIAVVPTSTAVSHPQVNQHNAPASAVEATSAHVYTTQTEVPISTTAPVYPAQADAPISTSTPVYPAQAEEKATAPASGGISSYIPKHIPTPTHAQMAMAAGAFGAISSASAMAGGAARSHGVTEAAHALSGIGNASAYAARATSGMNGAGMNANTAAKVTATAAKLLELSGLSSLW